MRTLVALILLGAASPALGQADPVARFGRSIADEAAQQEIRLALTNVDKATCESGRPCAAATEAELQKPPISVEDARAAMAFAVQSALAQWCGLDWKRSLIPMIVFGKNKKRMTDRQLQLMSLIHGDFQRRQIAFYKGRGACPDTLRTQLDSEMPRL